MSLAGLAGSGVLQRYLPLRNQRTGTRQMPESNILYRLGVHSGRTTEMYDDLRDERRPVLGFPRSSLVSFDGDFSNDDVLHWAVGPSGWSRGDRIYDCATLGIDNLAEYGVLEIEPHRWCNSHKEL